MPGRSQRWWIPALSLGLLTALTAGLTASQISSAKAAAAQVLTVRVPGGGYQVQTATDARGTVHAVYVKGEPASADLFYARLEGGRWSTPIPVSGRAGSAVAMGTIRGPQVALGRGGRVHVVWFGSAKSGLKGPQDSAPLLYARLNDAGTAFEAERNLMQVSTSLDGGPSVAGDAAGNVLVAWQAGEQKGQREGSRRLWVSRSADDGKSFSREAAAWAEPTGACPCCSVKVFSDSSGRAYALYRMAANRTERDMVLLTSSDRGRTFRGARIDPWPVDT